MSEAELLAAVIDLAGRRGVLALHVPERLSRAMGPAWAGFPDLLLLGDTGALWAELKADGRAGQLRGSQRQFRDRLIAAGELFVCWSPADLRSGKIRDALDTIAIG